ncbi:MAG: 4-alpha-glucanotransferase [Candidatus Omnitrophica bacterium]|nr:4-alpha-glucanotransferase [Candidatus Omnitrophota bacterium]
MLETRSCGILCHISSLPSSFGIGDLGPEAYRFVDFLSKSGQRWWQILPINPTEPGLANSPYSSFSAFAGNPLFISPELLVKEGFLDKNDIVGLTLIPGDKVDYEAAAAVREALVNKAYARHCSRWLRSRSFENFCVRESSWLNDFSLFVVMKRHFHGVSWSDWAVDLRDRDPGALDDFSAGHAISIDREKFAQYLFFRQWAALGAYCSRKDVGLIGDIPIYVNYDSADVWVHPDLFKLDGDHRQTFVAGVPPDYFSKDGQRWGNPVYDWDRLRQIDFSWWVHRVRHNLALFDAVRVDHFRGFVKCWEIPAKEKTAIRGAWRDVPGEEIFKTLQRHFPKLPIIAEDLGIITKDVDALKEKFGFPGMCVLMFAFHNEYKESRDFPQNYKPGSVVYTGTHDNNTICGWYQNDLSDIEKKNILEYFGREIDPSEINWVMIEEAMKSVANIAIIPLQDLLGLGGEARMNRPSTVKGNWLWRCVPGVLGKDLSRRLANITIKSNR